MNSGPKTRGGCAVGSKAALVPCRLQCPVCLKADNQACCSITSSARARILGGTSRPRAREVFRLITRLNWSAARSVAHLAACLLGGGLSPA
jgi:hypothetical protein